MNQINDNEKKRAFTPPSATIVSQTAIDVITASLGGGNGFPGEWEEFPTQQENPN